MMVPPVAPEDELKSLLRIYDSYDDVKEINSINSSFPSIYLLQELKMLYLFKCSPLDVVDRLERQIYGMEGVAIERGFWRDFWCILPKVLLNLDQLFLKQRDLSPKRNDKLRRVSSDKEKLDSKILSSTSYFEISKKEELAVRDNNPIILPFNKTGFESLVKITSSPHLPLVNFAFGATNQIQQVADFKILAFITHSDAILEKREFAEAGTKVSQIETSKANQTFNSKQVEHYVEYETCETQLFSAMSGGSRLFNKPNVNWVFVAVSTSKKGGVIAQSEVVEKTSYSDEAPNILQVAKNVEILRKMLDEMETLGWKVYSRGEPWWRVTLRKYRS
ncbi:MAG: hypothetical protein JNJ72_06670 [Anaerolineales bacterium]|nr:hypothetical protein [Anaerolineales bacterium]